MVHVCKPSYRRKPCYTYEYIFPSKWISSWSSRERHRMRHCACAKCCVFPLWSSVWPDMCTCVFYVCAKEKWFIWNWNSIWNCPLPSTHTQISPVRICCSAVWISKEESFSPFCCRYATIREINFESHHKCIIWVHKYVACLLNIPVRHLHFDCHDDAVLCRIWSFNSACALLLTC